jgi:DNA primase
MGNISSWLIEGFDTLSKDHQSYLSKRGVDGNTSVDFFTWKTPDPPCPCPRFMANFGENGYRLRGKLVTPIRSPRGAILGMEARSFSEDGSKRVFQYRTNNAQWNPYFLGAERAFKTLWQGGDLWIVEGIFDMVALEKVVAKSDAVISTLRAGMDMNSINMITRFITPHSSIYISYDNDETGKSKSDWLRNKFTSEGARVYQARYRGKDPNEVWKLGGERLLRRYFG